MSTLGLIVKKLGFQKNLSNVMNSNYWTRADYRNYNSSETLDKNDDQVSGKSIGSRGAERSTDVGQAPGVRVPVEPAGSIDLSGDFGKRLKSQVEEVGSRLVSGPKQKENILAKYQEKFGNGKR